MIVERLKWHIKNLDNCGLCELEPEFLQTILAELDNKDKQLELKDKVIQELKEMCYQEINSNAIPLFQFQNNMDTAIVRKNKMAHKLLLKILSFENLAKESK